MNPRPREAERQHGVGEDHLGAPSDPALQHLLRQGLTQALLEVVRPAAPCRLMDDVIGPGAMKALHARGGTVFRILEGGAIRVGDPVVREGS